jgi:hypothetical protein
MPIAATARTTTPRNGRRQEAVGDLSLRHDWKRRGRFPPENGSLRTAVGRLPPRVGACPPTCNPSHCALCNFRLHLAGARAIHPFFFCYFQCSFFLFLEILESFQEFQFCAKSEFSPETMQRVLQKRSDIYWEAFSSRPVGAASALALYASGVPGIPEFGEIRVLTGLRAEGLVKTFGRLLGGVFESPGRRGFGPSIVCG